MCVHFGKQPEHHNGMSPGRPGDIPEIFTAIVNYILIVMSQSEDQRPNALFPCITAANNTNTAPSSTASETSVRPLPSYPSQTNHPGSISCDLTSSSNFIPSHPNRFSYRKD